MSEIWRLKIIYIVLSLSSRKLIAPHIQRDIKVHIFISRVDSQAPVIIICEGSIEIKSDTSNIGIELIIEHIV